MIRVCIQSEKPRARWHMTAGRSWCMVRCPLTSGTGWTLDEALAQWKQRRVHIQIYGKA